MKSKNLIISTGFAMFSMFFGSGNLVFPLSVGKDCSDSFMYGATGIFLTGVLVPFLGVIAMMFYKGNTEKFFSCMGEKASKFWFPLIALSLMGPFGVLARCITVAHGSFRLLFSETSLIAFSLAICSLIYFVTINRSRIVPILGTLLTPLLLLSLGAITLCGIWYGPSIETNQIGEWNALKIGVFQGYQTMDLLAAFFFSTFVLSHLEEKKEQANNEAFLKKIFFKSACLGAFLLAVVYFCLVFLGASYRTVLENTPPQEMFGVIAENALGPQAIPVVCMTVVLACFTTAVVLTTLFADFFHKEITNEKIGSKTSIVITLIIAFIISTLEFAGIAKFLAPILETLYPALIVMTGINISHKLLGFKNRKWPVAITFLAKLCTI